MAMNQSARDQHVKCDERRTRPCHRAYSIRGSTPFHWCVEVRSLKLVSSEDPTGARAPSASYCSTGGGAPLHTAPPVPVKLFYKTLNFVWLLVSPDVKEQYRDCHQFARVKINENIKAPIRVGSASSSSCRIYLLGGLQKRSKWSSQRSS
jgi:hypothetical protein